MKTLLVLLALSLSGASDMPPMPSGVTLRSVPLRSPKHAEQLESLRKVRSPAPLAKATPPGLVARIVTAGPGQVTLSWSGVPGPYAVLKQVEGKGSWLQVGEMTSETNMTIDVSGPLDLFRIQAFPSNAPPTANSVILGLGGMNFPIKMAHRADGLHGLLRGLYGTQNDLFLFHDLSDVRSVSMPGSPNAAGCVTDFFGDNRLAYVEANSGTNRLIEWAFDAAMSNATVATSFGFPHPYSAVASCTYSNRPVIMSADNDVDVTNRAQMGLMVVWQDASRHWQQKRIIMDSSTSADKLPTVGLSMVEFDGAVYAFFTRDSSAAIGLVKLAGEPLTVTYSNASWLNSYPQTYPLSLVISGEAPTIWAAVDSAQGRIVLSYQCQEGESTHCVGMVNNSTRAHMSLVGLAQPGDLPYLITETGWFDSHTSFGLIPVWADATGITFNTPFWSLNCDWAQNGIQGARFDYASSNCAQTWFIAGGNASVESYSDDGWAVIFTDDWVNHLCYAR